MTPVKQSIIYNDQTIGNGDCLTACYASLFDLPLWCVPPFHQMFGRPDCSSRIETWFKKVMKMKLVRIYEVERPEDQTHDERLAMANLPEFYVACGPTVRGGNHAVVYSKGVLAHDPHSSDAGLLRVTRIEYAVPL